MWRAVPHQPDVMSLLPVFVSMNERWATAGSSGFVRKTFFSLLEARKI